MCNFSDGQNYDLNYCCHTCEVSDLPKRDISHKPDFFRGNSAQKNRESPGQTVKLDRYLLLIWNNFCNGIWGHKAGLIVG